MKPSNFNILPKVEDFFRIAWEASEGRNGSTTQPMYTSSEEKSASYYTSSSFEIEKTEAFDLCLQSGSYGPIWFKYLSFQFILKFEFT